MIKLQGAESTLGPEVANNTTSLIDVIFMRFSIYASGPIFFINVAAMEKLKTVIKHNNIIALGGASYLMQQICSA